LWPSFLLADTAEESVKLWESPEDNNLVQGHKRTACKAFHHQGSQQCGSFTMFKEYLKSHQINKILLSRFAGNKFNILFYNAAGVYYLHSYMISFIETVHGNQANRLLQAVLADLKNPAYIAGCRALRQGNYWPIVEKIDHSVLQMSNIYSDLKNKFDTWKEDAVSLSKGEAFLDTAGDVHVDEIWEALIQPNDNDSKTTELLQFLCSAISTTTQRICC